MEIMESEIRERNSLEWDSDDNDLTLKPCPFCGSTDIRLNAPGARFDYYCNTCEASGPKTTLSKENAREMWNQRGPASDLLAACEKFSKAHSAGPDDMSIVDPQDWAEFDIAIAKARG